MYNACKRPASLILDMLRLPQGSNLGFTGACVYFNEAQLLSSRWNGETLLRTASIVATLDDGRELNCRIITL